MTLQNDFFSHVSSSKEQGANPLLMMSHPSPLIKASSTRRYAVIIPACNEAACIGAVIGELKAVLDEGKFMIAVGVNGSTDATFEIAKSCGVMAAQAAQRGYGYGCQAAVEAVNASLAPGEEVAGYLFVAADGANDPRDIAALVEKHQRGFDLVMGARTTLSKNRGVMNPQHVLANRVLGLLCGVLTLGYGARWFADLGPLRLIDAGLFRRLALQEWTYGWTIEAQVRSVMLGAAVCEVPVLERPRLAGEQKISGVSLRKTLSVGRQIFLAGWRTRQKGLRQE